MESIQDHLAKLMNKSELSKQYQTILKEKVFADPDVQAFIKAHKDSLDREGVLKSASKLYEFVQEKEKIQKAAGDTSVSVVQGHYPRLVYHNKRILVEYVPSQDEINRRKIAAAKNRFKPYHISQEVTEANFDDLYYTDDRMPIIDKVISFIEKTKENPDDFHQGIYLQGSFGVGKTYILGAMAKVLADLGKEVSLVHFPSFSVEIKAAIGDNTVEAKLNQFKETEILILDDIGAESMTAWLRDDILSTLLQYRMQHNLPTFFTSNFSMKQLEEEHLAQVRGNEPVKAARIMERIRYLAKEVEMTGKNHRNK